MPRAAKPKSLVGVVSSDKMQKTIMVQVERRALHPRYHKYVKKKTRYKAHDEENAAGIGDTVRIVPTRPLSKEKHWRLVEVLSQANRP